MMMNSNDLYLNKLKETVLFDHFKGKQAAIEDAEQKLERRNTMPAVRLLMKEGRSTKCLSRRIIADAV